MGLDCKRLGLLVLVLVELVGLSLVLVRLRFLINRLLVLEGCRLMLESRERFLVADGGLRIKAVRGLLDHAIADGQ